MAIEPAPLRLPHVLRDAVAFELPATARSAQYEIIVLPPPAAMRAGAGGQRVLIVLDSPYVLGTVAESVYIQSMGGEISPPTIVGIGAAGNLEAHADARLFDFTPAASSPTSLRASPVLPMLSARARARGVALEELTGGAGGFLDFICDRLLPRLPDVLGEDVVDIGLLGQSAGAVFSRYALLSGRSPFSKFALGSLGVGWYGEDLRSLEDALVAGSGPRQPIDVFQAVGGAELSHARFGPALQAGLDAMKELARRLPDRIRLTQSVFADETHTSMLACLAAAALRNLYGTPSGFMDSL